MRGKIKFYKKDKGFGFITPDDGSPDVFFHISAVDGTEEDIRQDAKVNFDIAAGKNGRPKAINVIF